MTTYKLDELAKEADVSARTIRYYVQRGLLPAPDFRGAQTAYGPAHLLRLRVIKRLQAEHQPLEAIASRLAGESVDELERMLKSGARASPPSDPPPLGHGSGAGGPYRSAPRAPADERRETWERVELMPGVELHVKADASAIGRRVAREIQTLYGPFSSKDIKE